MFQVEAFWIVTSCGVVVGYQRFRGPCCLHLQDDGGPLKLWHATIILQGVTTPKTWTWNLSHFGCFAPTETALVAHWRQNCVILTSFLKILCLYRESNPWRPTWEPLISRTALQTHTGRKEGRMRWSGHVTRMKKQEICFVGRLHVMEWFRLGSSSRYILVLVMNLHSP